MEMILDYGSRRAVARGDNPKFAFTMDAPTSCGGPGENPCPVDTFGASLAACMTMAMDIAAERKGFDITGSKITVNVESFGCGQPMLGKVLVTICPPRPLEDEEIAVLRKGAASCPIHNSLRPEVEVDLLFENPKQ